MLRYLFLDCENVLPFGLSFQAETMPGMLYSRYEITDPSAMDDLYLKIIY